MKHFRQFLMLFVAMVGMFPAMAFSQVDTGFPPFSSITGGPDHINLSNLNIHWEFPIVSKAGRGLPFDYAIAFDNFLLDPATTMDGWEAMETVLSRHSWFRTKPSDLRMDTADRGDNRLRVVFHI